MKPKRWQWLILIVAQLAMSSAHAQMGHRQRPPRHQGESDAMQFQPRPERERDAQREMQPSPARMSPEERRQLRRDIHDAGRELYRRDSSPPSPPPQ